jgi:transcriptional regulator with XRE-family HTH domain
MLSMDRLGEKLRLVRKHRKLSQAKMGVGLKGLKGTTPRSFGQFVSNLERGVEDNPRLDSLEALARGLKFESLSEFVLHLERADDLSTEQFATLTTNKLQSSHTVDKNYAPPLREIAEQSHHVGRELSPIAEVRQQLADVTQQLADVTEQYKHLADHVALIHLELVKSRTERATPAPQRTPRSDGPAQSRPRKRGAGGR